jgi:hypothetical protein
MAAVSRVCGATGFMVWCQQVCGLYLQQSGNPALTGAVLAAHASGSTLGGTGMSNPMKAYAGIEPLLKSWTLIDNHDMPRVATQLPQQGPRRLAQVLQFTLPGAPNIYYGAELGMPGGGDPENRGPMRWDLVRDDNDELRWMRQLVGLRQQHRALRVGDFRLVDAQQLFAFERHTDRVLETRIIVANPSDKPVRERLQVANADLMDDTPMVDLLLPPGSAPVASFGPGLVTVDVPAHGVRVLAPAPKALGGYSRYKRVS